MSRTSPRLSSAAAILLCTGVIAACTDPQCAVGDAKMDDTCCGNEDGGRRNASAAEGASMAADDETTSSGDISVDPADEAGRADDTSVDAGRDAGDAGRDAGDAGREAGPPDASEPLDGETAVPAVDAAAPVDGDSAPDSAVLNTDTITCASRPCQNGGSCTDDAQGARCSCAEAFTGEWCESRTCTTMVLRNDEDLARARSCSEIQGDLSVTSAGIAAITASDLPYLTKITGHFSMSGLSNSGVETPRLRELTLPKLREIGKSLSVALTGPGSVSEIHFPALTRVGGGVVFADTETRRLALPVLRAVDGGFWLLGLDRLCTLEIEAIEQISESLYFADLLNLPASALEPLRRAFSGTPTAENRIGCCLATDGTCIEGFSSEEREAFCGCSSP